MSSVDNKKTKRRKNKKNTAVKNVMGLNHGPNMTTTTTTTTTCSANTKLASSSSSSVAMSQQTSSHQTIKDHTDENLTLPILFTNRGLNSYIDKDKCLLCSCERTDSSPQAAWLKSDVGKNTMYQQEVACFSKECLNAAASSPILREINSASTELNSNGLVCSCVSCLERRQKEEEHRKETLDLQKSWSEVRRAVRSHYSEYLNDSNNTTENSSAYEMQVKENIHRLCTRDPHQLFMRLESQAKEFVIEKRKKLLNQLDIGYTCLNEARDFVFLLLEEYRQLCQAASKVSNILTELEKDHLKRFDVTWNIHNKHLFHSIVYTNPSIQDRLPAVLKQLSAASCDSNGVEPYPTLSDRCCKFGEEMEKVSLMWKGSQKLIASYNEEQAALKLKHKMLTEDWEFFKKQRKMLEKRTSESSNPFLPNRSLSNACCLFACSCPCHESTSESISTCCCRLLNEKCENVSHHQPISLLHDPSHCVLDINPPSISSTTSSSGSSSPIIDSERLSVTFGDCTQPFENGNAEMEDSQTDDDEDDYDDDDDDDDDYQEEEEDEVEEEEVSLVGFDDVGVLPSVANGNLDISIVSWTDKKQKITESSVDEVKADNCDYHHYISTNPEQIIKSDDNQCQCHFCLRQRGNTVSTSLPQHVPVLPRPAHLHLYPHIHGPSGLHALHGSAGPTNSGSSSGVATTNGNTNGTSASSSSSSSSSTDTGSNGGATPGNNSSSSSSSSHTRPILQHQWDVEVQLQQTPKFIISPQSKLSLPLDGFSTSSLNDHEHTYQGDWDNTQFDPRLLLSPHKFVDNLGSDLLSCPTTSLANSSSPSSDSGLSSQGTVIDNPNSALTANRVSSGLDPSPSVEVQVRVQQNEISQQHRHHHHHHHHQQQQQQQQQAPPPPPPPPPASTSSSSSSCSSFTSSSSTTETCSKAHKWNSQNGTSKNHSCNRPATLGGNSSPHNEKVHPQVCKKHGANPPNAEINSRNGSIVKEDATARQSRFFPNNNNNNNSSSMLNQYPCTHANNSSNSSSSSSSNSSVRNGTSQVYSGSGNAEPNLCVNAVSLPTTMNNVSVGTSTVCTDPECLTHQEDNEDSVDDSCSEQSSSTSASNQKEGKYCDCCYCEFFGHGTPPKAPTSHKFYEMREKLQQKLKKKKEAMVQKKDDDDQIPDPLDQRGLDDLVRYINGYEDSNWGGKSTSNSEKPISAKAAKRARQKQRKAEEKAKLEAQQCDTNCLVVDYTNGCQISQLYSNSNFLVKLKKKRIKQKLLQAVCSEEEVEDVDEAQLDCPNSQHLQNRKDTKKCSTLEINCQQNSLSLSSSFPKLKTKNTVHRKTETFENNCQKQQQHHHHHHHELVAASEDIKLTAEINEMLIANKCQSKKNKPSRKVSSQNGVLPKNGLTTSCSQEEATTHTAIPNLINSAMSGTERSKGKNTNVSSNSVKDSHDQNNAHESGSSNNKKSKKSLEKPGSSGHGKLSNGNCQKSTSKVNHDIQAARLLTNTTSLQQCEQKSVKDHAGKETEQKVSVDDKKGLKTKDADRRTEGSHSTSLPKAVDQKNGKSKRNKKKNKTSDVNFVEDVFLPKSESDLENGEMDEAERELEEFKRFCLDSTQQKKDKLQVNMNLKDIFTKKKGVSCS